MSTPETSTTSTTRLTKPTNRRANQLARYCRLWIAENRPDVWEAIQQELDRQYPRQRVQRGSSKLPEALRSLK